MDTLFVLYFWVLPIFVAGIVFSRVPAGPAVGNPRCCKVGGKRRSASVPLALVKAGNPRGLAEARAVLSGLRETVRGGLVASGVVQAYSALAGAARDTARASRDAVKALGADLGIRLTTAAFYSTEQRNAIQSEGRASVDGGDAAYWQRYVASIERRYADSKINAARYGVLIGRVPEEYRPVPVESVNSIDVAAK